MLQGPFRGTLTGIERERRSCRHSGDGRGKKVDARDGDPCRDPMHLADLARLDVRAGSSRSTHARMSCWQLS